MVRLLVREAHGGHVVLSTDAPTLQAFGVQDSASGFSFDLGDPPPSGGLSRPILPPWQIGSFI